MSSISQFTVRDFSDEKSTFRLNVPDVTAANFDATISAITGLNTAVAAVTLGNITAVNLTAETGLAGADIRPSNPFAQRELGARFYYQDNVTGEKFHFTIPCADLSIVGQGGTDAIDLTLSLVAPIKTFFEALVVSQNGNPVTITSARVVGRNS